LADTCGYELPTNLQNFTQKDFTYVKSFRGLLFLNTLSIRTYTIVSYVGRTPQRPSGGLTAGSSMQSSCLTD